MEQLKRTLAHVEALTAAPAEATVAAPTVKIPKQNAQTIARRESGIKTLRPVPRRLVYTAEARHARIDHLESTGADLSELREMRLEEASLRGNIESLLGAVEIPVGVAGPLTINSHSGIVQRFAPIATSEGALLSSINRGCRALQMSGGVTARSLKQRMVRAPFFDCGSLLNCMTLKNWLSHRQAEISHKIRQFSNHAVLIELNFRIIAPCLHVRFVYETGDAAGQNMTTVCTWNACNWIQKEFEREHPNLISHFMIDGNLSTDKKASTLSAIEGRGHEVIAEALIPEAVLRRVLHSTSEEMARFFVQCQSTGVLTGVHGLNINAANVIAGVFAATGQDVACVHESSTAQLHFEKRPEGLYASVLLPNLVVGTVGGGVGLAAQKQLLDLMGCYGARKSRDFAEAVASFVLALELSTGAALAGGQFATAHERLGRHKSTNWLQRSDLTAAFFNHLINPPEIWGSVIEATALESANEGASLVMDLTAQISRRPCGLWGYQLSYSERLGADRVFVKSKVADHELLLAFEIMAGISSPGLGELLREHRQDNPFNKFHIRELKIAEMKDLPLQNIMPKTLGTMLNQKREIYILAQEYLENLELFGAVENRTDWTPGHLGAALAQIGEVHGHFLGKTETLTSEPWMFNTDSDMIRRLEETNFELARHLQVGDYEWFSDEDLEFHRLHLRTFPKVWDEMQLMHRTLIHGDFNPRNIGFRRSENRQKQIVAHDWELATVHIPQRDGIELLSFTLRTDLNSAELARQLNAWIEFHRKIVEHCSGTELEPEVWRRGYTYACLDLLLQRLPIYGIAKTFRNIDFLKPTYRMARRLLEILSQGGVL